MLFFANRTVGAVGLVVVLGLGVCFLTGCGGVEYEGAQRAAVSGTVTLDGTPLQYGVITFVPADGAGKRASGVINNGAYSIPEAEGPNLGEYKVEVVGSEKPDEGGGEDGMEGGDDEEEDDEEEGDDEGDDEGGAGENAMV
ncbi:MAG: hypothetical protein HQ582_14650, partial [Planctomycetes bacterium]|nr:hypothetical protein [Planctomycetota bacterium]